MPSIEPKGGAGCPSGHVRICAGGVWDNPRSYRNPYAKGAVEMAAYDLAGRTLGVPVHRLLGGMLREAVPITHSIGDYP